MDLTQHSLPDSSPGKPRAKVSAFVICFNEEKHIKECLESLSFCDEIVVVDSNSTDQTPQICQALNVRLIQRDWPGYKEQKSFGLSQTTYEWVINLDADERISSELRDEIISVLERDAENSAGMLNKGFSVADAYEVSRVVYFLGRWWRRCGWYPEYRVRFFRKSKIVWGGKDPHEKPRVLGQQARLGGEILHFTYENIEGQLKQLNHFAAIAAGQEWERGNRANIWHLIVNPTIRFLKFFLFKQGFREGMAGFIVAVNEAFYTFSKYSLLWEYALREHQGNDGEKGKGVSS
jgi:glycosyltransferase involved in cell wall biosynthesis